MARADLAALYQSLIVSQFRFVGSGEITIDLIYEHVRNAFPAFCDDSYLCSENCGGVHHQPEWKHVIRKALTDLKRRGFVTQGQKRRSWLIGSRRLMFVEDDLEEFNEGRELRQLHKRRERNREAVRRKKEQVLNRSGRLVCEACGIDPDSVYGIRGYLIAECHHRIPLAELRDTPRQTKLSDLAIVCPNCHRFLHRCRPMLTVEELHSFILQTRAARVA